MCQGSPVYGLESGVTFFEEAPFGYRIRRNTALGGGNYFMSEARDGAQIKVLGYGGARPQIYYTCDNFWRLIPSCLGTWTLRDTPPTTWVCKRRPRKAPVYEGIAKSSPTLACTTFRRNPSLYSAEPSKNMEPEEGLPVNYSSLQGSLFRFP